MSRLGIIESSIVAIYLAAMIFIGFWTKRLAAALSVVLYFTWVRLLRENRRKGGGEK